jgi:tRNA G46 methylase TrmB
MKVIDLLNKIANVEEVPKKIKYEGDIYIHTDNYCYFCKETNKILSQNIYAEFSRLNDEIEIIEDTPKEDKKIEKMEFCYEVSDKIQNANNERFKDFINEIIDKLNGEDNGTNSNV